MILERIMPRRGLYGDPTQFGEFIDGGFSSKTAVAAGLHASERHLRLVVYGRPIDVAHPGVDALGDFDSASYVTAEYRCRKSVFGVVCKRDCFFDGLETSDGNRWSKRLFTEHLHFGSDMVNDHSRHDGALGLAAEKNFCAVRHRIFYQRAHSINGRHADDSSENNLTFSRIAAR